MSVVLFSDLNLDTLTYISIQIRAMTKLNQNNVAVLIGRDYRQEGSRRPALKEP